MNESAKPSLLERLSSLLLREPEDREQLIELLHSAFERRLLDAILGGSMSRVADQVFLLTPSNVEVSQEEKERLQARGLFRA